MQPPGRDARADEPNETDVDRCIAETAAALKPHLVMGADARDGPTVFIGDSWGAIAAFATAHELLKSCGWAPSHMLVSGNASPRVTSAHFGLGSYSPTPMVQLSDKQLVDFLRASGVEDEDDERVGQLVAPFRADCQLYENYVRPEQLPALPTKLCVLRGKEDKVERRPAGWTSLTAATRRSFAWPTRRTTCTRRSPTPWPARSSRSRASCPCLRTEASRPCRLWRALHEQCGSLTTRTAILKYYAAEYERPERVGERCASGQRACLRVCVSSCAACVGVFLGVSS